MNYRSSLLLAILVACPTGSALARQNVSLRKGINDYANIVDPQTEQALDNYLLELEQKTGAQLRVLTINSTRGRDLYDYTMELARREKLGQKDEDNGVVVAIAVRDRKWRIVTGEGIEDTLPDLYCDSIAQSYFIPNFKNGDFSRGIHQGTVAMAQKIASDAGVTLSGAPRMSVKHSGRRARRARGIPCFAIFIFFIIIGSFLGGRRRRHYGTWGGGGLWQGILLGSLLSGMGRSSGSSWSGGSSWGGGGGFGGGGFGGFGGGGGGSFGGGGAGGSW